MATPQFDPNAWYSLRNFGNGFYLGCNSISICGADTNSNTTFERFQITQVNDLSPFFVRPEARTVDSDGAPFCININSGQPFLELCTNTSAIWGTGYWNGNNSDDGLFFYNVLAGDDGRLFLSDNGTWSFPDYQGVASDETDQLRWRVQSLAEINEVAYSTTPAVISDSVPMTTLSLRTIPLLPTPGYPSNTTNVTATITTAPGPVSLSSSGASMTITSGSVQTAETASGVHGSSSVASPTVSIASTSGVDRSRPSTGTYVLAALSVMTVLLQVIS